MAKENIFKRGLSALFSEKRSTTVDWTNGIGLPYGYANSPVSLQAAMQLSVVYRCVEVISDAIASQTWDVAEYNEAEGFVVNQFHPASYMLNFEPNRIMSRFTMMKTLVAKALLEGNGYIHIIRDYRGDPVKLELITPLVTMFRRPNGTVYYEVVRGAYNDLYYFPGQPTFNQTIEGDDMIHILNFSYDGLMGVSTLRHATNSMGLSTATEASAKGFFSSGANMSGILTSEGKMTQEKATALKQAWAAAFNITSGNPGGIAVMEAGLEFKPVTVNPKDAQMLETRQYNAIEICRFFGVSPSKVFDSNNLTYSNIESFQLGFLTDTVSPWDSKIEAEFNRKLFRPSQRLKTRVHLNINELFRANLQAKADYTSKMFQAGGFTVNEVRKECGNPKHDDKNADIPMVQINMQTVNDFGKNIKPRVDNVPQSNK